MGKGYDEPQEPSFDYVKAIVSLAEAEEADQADHHDGPCSTVDCQRCRSERAEARIAELEAENAALKAGRCEAGHEDCDA